MWVDLGTKYQFQNADTQFPNPEKTYSTPNA